MDAAGEVNNYAVYAMPRQAARQYINLNHLPGALRHLGLFFMLVATSFIIQNLGQSSIVSTGDAFTIFSTFILSLWMLMLSPTSHVSISRRACTSSGNGGNTYPHLWSSH